jgi:hypothetical protein
LKAAKRSANQYLPKIRRLSPDPYSAGRRSYEKGEPFDPDFGRSFAAWGPISAQCLYEKGRLSAAAAGGLASRAKSKGKHT